MRNIKLLVVCIISVLLLGCENHKNITFWLNPSQAFDIEKIHLTLELNQQQILDTIVDNKHIDKSFFLKKFSLKLDESNMLNVKINNQRKIVPISGFGCSDIFIDYDDHSLLYHKASEIENRKKDNGLVSDFKQIVDSLKKTSETGLYDKIEVSIKNVKCQN